MHQLYYEVRRRLTLVFNKEDCVLTQSAVLQCSACCEVRAAVLNLQT